MLKFASFNFRQHPCIPWDIFISFPKFYQTNKNIFHQIELQNASLPKSLTLIRLTITYISFHQSSHSTSAYSKWFEFPFNQLNSLNKPRYNSSAEFKLCKHNTTLPLPSQLHVFSSSMSAPVECPSNRLTSRATYYNVSNFNHHLITHHHSTPFNSTVHRLPAWLAVRHSSLTHKYVWVQKLDPLFNISSAHRPSPSLPPPPLAFYSNRSHDKDWLTGGHHMQKQCALLLLL